MRTVFLFLTLLFALAAPARAADDVAAKPNGKKPRRKRK